VAAPIVVELAPSPSSTAADPDLSRALIDACSGAAGPGGCLLEGLEPVEPRARVLVSFTGGDAGVHVEVLAPLAVGAGRSREVAFRDDDPRVERFRAAGLIVAGLVTDLTAGEPAAIAPPPLSPSSPTPPGELPRRVLVRLEGQSGWNGTRPWAGASLGADLGVVGPAFLALSGSYGQTWTRDARGIAAQRTAFGVGGGVAAWLVPERLELRLRVALELQELRASIRQPTTLREDSAGRTSSGIGAGLDLVLPITPSLDGFCGGGADWWGGETTVRVGGSPDETVGAWLLSIGVGLNVRLP
jgi:hypothetical protein